MPISEKDRKFMKEVAAYFRSTKTGPKMNGSIRDTAIKFGINRNKVRKILITMGEIVSPITESALYMRQKGMSIKEIARDLGVSVATVSTALPYEDKVDNTLDPSEHASDVRRYRAYEHDQWKRQTGRDGNKPSSSAAAEEDNSAKSTQYEKEWQKDIRMSYTEAYHRPHRNTWKDLEAIREELMKSVPDAEKILADLDAIKAKEAEEEKELNQLLGKERRSEEEENSVRLLSRKRGEYLGALNDRNRGVLEQIAGNRLPPEPMGVIRLRMELCQDYSSDQLDEELTAILRKYGKLEYGNTISRDIIAPGDMPLYALHYVIQRAFGWQNSHLRQFVIPKDRCDALTNGTASVWSCMVGVLFQSPLMDEEDQYWADDYHGGSFKNWLRKKYTGPYLSQCHGEGFLSCQEDMMKLDMDREYYVLYSGNNRAKRKEGKERVAVILPVYDWNGNKLAEPNTWDNAPCRVEVMKLKQIPSDGLYCLFERNPMAILERLPIQSVLAAGGGRLPSDCSAEERKKIEEEMMRSGYEVYQDVEKYIKCMLSEQIDSPEQQVCPLPFTDVLFYNYDFGDDWKIRITASENCEDLVESGRITQAELDRAHVKCREVYRPVLIAKDGENLVEDVGGVYGFAEFLQTINPKMQDMTPEEEEIARQEKKESLEWAKSLGWKRENVSDFNLL